MRFFYMSALIALVFAACYNGGLHKYLSPDKLPEQSFTINTQADTTIVTAQGIKIQIPSGAINNGSNTATLVVKEALTLDDMLRAGLTTTTNGELLASDGMFYINTKEKSNLTKPLHIFLPTAIADNKMQLYNGVEKDSGIDWQNPQNLNKPVTTMTDTGKVLFEGNCASCHAVDKAVIGDALAWEDKRKPMQWVRDITHNNKKVIARGDKYACCKFNAFGGAGGMTIFDSLSDYQVDAIYRYIDKVSEEKGIPQPTGKGLSACDSCNYYHDYYYKLAHARDSLTANNGLMVDINITPPADVYFVKDTTVDEVITPASYDAEYYQFDIDAFGWLNVDALLSGFPGLAESNLKVTLSNAGTDRMEVFMIVPAYKVFQKGGLLNDGKNFGFYKKDGTVNLMQGQTTIVFAVGEEGGKTYFGETSFAAALSQTVTINVHESDKREIEHFFKNAHAEKIKMDVSKTKNYKSIKAIDDEIGSARKALSKCTCMEARDTAIDNISVEK